MSFWKKDKRKHHITSKSDPTIQASSERTSKATGIPTSQAGLERKIGAAIINSITCNKK